MLFLTVLLWLAVPSTPGYAQDPSQDQPQPQPSLADVARQARKDKEKNATKPKMVITDDTLPSSKGFSGFADLGSQAGGGSSSMAKALAKIDEAEAALKQMDALDRATLAKAVLLDNDVDFPNRRNWEDKLYVAKESYVSHERELIVELKQIMGRVQSWQTSQGGQGKLDPNDPRAQQTIQRVQEIIQDAVRTEQDYRAVVMEGWDLAKQAKH
jgi:hypothetical protein